MSTEQQGAAQVLPFFDEDTSTFSYIVKDPGSAHCAIIDPVLDFDYASGTVSHQQADAMIEHVRAQGLTVDWIIETHVHADHLSSAEYLKEQLGGKTGISEHVHLVQDTFARIFNTGAEFKHDGSQFDHLFKHEEQYRIGGLTGCAILTPGHTPACMTHLIGDAAFVGDTLFMPDVGTARADFPGGDAAALYDSVQTILSLPADTRLFMCHDYPDDDRPPEYESSIAAQKAENIHVCQRRSKQEFVQLREARDQTLEMPRLILPSLQVNMRAGQFPPADDDGRVFLKVPVNAFV